MTPDLEQMAKYAVLLGSHGNEMEVGRKLQKKIDTNPISNVTYRIAHPEAVTAGVRYLGETAESEELMRRYPGDPSGDPEQRAAYENLVWIEKIKPVVVFDIHETTPTGSYFALGETSSLAAISGGKLFSNRCIIEDSPFYQSVPHGVAIENSLADTDPDILSERIYSRLNQVSSVNLQQIPFDQTMAGLTFYQKFEIRSIGQEGTLKPEIPELESIPNNPRFSPIILTDRQKELLVVPRDAKVVYGTWGHDNMSTQMPQTLGYTASGIPRREYFGSFYIQIAPPLPSTDGHVIFQKEKRPLSRKPQGLLRLAA